MAAAKKVRTLLIDADILMFRFAFRHQEVIQWSDDISSDILDAEQAKLDLDNFIYDLLKATNCVDYLLCFTHSVNFRYGLFPAYKANRAKLEPPKMLTILKTHMMDNHDWESREGLEADDMMGIMGTMYPDQFVLATIDKDFLSLPVLLYNWNHPKQGVQKISLRQADYMFHLQWLMGDSADGYGGVWRVGEKKARKILHGVAQKDFSKVVVETYAAKCYSWDELITQARMARILRCSDYTNNKVILWEPDC